MIKSFKDNDVILKIIKRNHRIIFYKNMEPEFKDAIRCMPINAQLFNEAITNAKNQYLTIKVQGNVNICIPALNYLSILVRDASIILLNTDILDKLSSPVSNLIDYAVKFSSYLEEGMSTGALLSELILASPLILLNIKIIQKCTAEYFRDK